VRGPAVELAEAVVEAQAADLGVAVSGADESDLGFPAAGLIEEVADEAQVVELRRQRGATHGNDLFFHWAHKYKKASPRRREENLLV
jgi:hypothetical protein